MKRRLSVAFLLLIGTFTYALAANRQVEGVVISSEDNLPLIGASVYVTADDLRPEKKDRLMKKLPAYTMP